MGVSDAEDMDLDDCGEASAEPVAFGEAPAEVASYADGCVRAVHRALGVAPDFGPETISLLDHYLTLIPERPRAPTRDPVRGLVAVMAGLYFGEVACRLFPSRWVMPPGSDPLEWRLEGEFCFLTFYPVAVGWEVLLRRDSPPGCTAAYLLEDPARAQVAERLDRLPPVTVDDYYTFAQRLETLVLTVGWLAERVRRSGRTPAAVPAERYVSFLERLRTRG
jgi:hypothetical protein